MDHAEAHELIADLALEPGALERLAREAEPRHDELRAHVAGCAICAADVAAWRDVQATLRTALGDADAATAPRAITPPASLRDTILRAARDEARLPVGAARQRPGDSPGAPIPFTTRRRITPVWVGLAAAIVIAIAGGAGFAVQTARLGAATDETAALTDIATTMNRILADPSGAVLALHTPDGTPAGSVAWSRTDLAVLTLALAPPATGSVYRCWLASATDTALIGEMEFSGQLAYWVGPADGWTSFSFTPGTRFVVTLGDQTINRMSGRTVLEAALGT